MFKCSGFLLFWLSSLWSLTVRPSVEKPSLKLSPVESFTASDDVYHWKYGLESPAEVKHQGEKLSTLLKIYLQKNGDHDRFWLLNNENCRRSQTNSRLKSCSSRLKLSREATKKVLPAINETKRSSVAGRPESQRRLQPDVWRRIQRRQVAGSGQSARWVKRPAAPTCSASSDIYFRTRE